MDKKDLFKLNSLYIDRPDIFAEFLMFDVYLAHKTALEELPSEDAMEKLEKLSTESLLDGSERDRGEVSAIVGSIAYKVSYDPKKQNSLYVAAELMDRLANKHVFLDGNKRTALYSAFIVLSIPLNIHIDLVFDNDEYIKEILLVVSQAQEGIDEETRISQICEFLKKIVENEISKKKN